MTLVHAAGVSFRHATHPDPLFSDLTFTLASGDHGALIGPNGAGKSTVLALLAGELQPTTGTIQRCGRVAAMPQRFQADDDDTVLDVALSGDDALATTRREMRRWEGGVADPTIADRYMQAFERYGSLDGYGREVAAQTILEGLGLPQALHERPVCELSSGQRSRVGLARLLLTPADLYLLDEPSNHLDLDGQRWLADYLQGLEAAFVLVTHDRLLLQHSINRVMELRRGQVFSHPGSYADFRQARATADTQAMQHYEAEQRRAKAAERAAMQRAQLAAKVARKPPAGQYSPASKPFYAAKAGRVARTARMLKEKTAGARSAKKPFVESGIGRLSFQHTPAGSGLALATRDLTCGYGDTPIIRGITLDLHHGERLAILGPNGAGKTTLLKTLAGQLPPLAGEIIRGQGSLLAMQHQERPVDLTDLSPLAMGLQLCPDEQWVRTILACLKLGPEHILRPFGTLSPGEQGKTELARMLLSGANLLILDEPTNHLDLLTREALEEVLAAFPGAILLVSHDAAFVEAVAERVIELADALSEAEPPSCPPGGNSAKTRRNPSAHLPL